MDDQAKNLDLSHHKQFEYCTNRPKYRNSRKLTAVKVYTIVDESRHLLVFGVPKINLSQELKRLFEKCGKLATVKVITNEIAANKSIELEQFTDCYHVAFQQIHCARRAKSMFDRRSFYGGILHVSYATEYETVKDLRDKFAARRRDVQYRLKKAHENPSNVVQRKRTAYTPAECDNYTKKMKIR